LRTSEGSSPPARTSKTVESLSVHTKGRVQRHWNLRWKVRW